MPCLMRAQSTRRYAVGWVAAAIVAIFALSMVGLIASRQGEEVTGSAGSAVVGMLPVVAVGAPATTDATARLPSADHGPAAVDVATPDASVTAFSTVTPVAAVTADAAVTAEVVVTIDAAVAAKPPAAVAPADPGRAVADAKVRARVQACADFEAHEKWADLRDCASGLAALAGHDLRIQARADEFRVKAVKETERALAVGKFKEAIAEGDLREAEKQLRSIGDDAGRASSTAAQAFRAAEERAIDESRRKAQALVADGDCAGVDRLRAQLEATSTIAVTGAVAVVAARCAAQASSPPTSTQVAASGDPAVKGMCERMNIDDVLLQARNQYQAGFPKAALQLLTKALNCRQDERMLRMAGLYACAAHDAQAAKLHYSKVPPQFQTAIVQRCQQEGISLQGP